MEYLVGDFSSSHKVPGNEGAICRVSTDDITAGHKFFPFTQKQDVQCLLNPSFVHSDHLKNEDSTFDYTIAKKKMSPFNHFMV